mgnify:CR=1 FL=1
MPFFILTKCHKDSIHHLFGGSRKQKIDYLCNEFDSKNGPENEMFFHFIFLSFSSTYVDNEIPV